MKRLLIVLMILVPLGVLAQGPIQNIGLSPSSNFSYRDKRIVYETVKAVNQLNGYGDEQFTNGSIWSYVEYLSLTGSDRDGDGTEDNPYRTLQPLIAKYKDSLIVGSTLAITFMEGTWDASEIFPKLRYIEQYFGRIGIFGQMTILDTINVTHDGTSSAFRYETDSTLVGDLSKKFITRIVAPMGYHLGYPIVSNTTSTFISPASKSILPGDTKYVSDWATIFEVDLNDNLRVGRAQIINIKFTMAEANVDYDFQFSEFLWLTACYFSGEYESYDLISINNTNCGITSCILEHTPSSSSGDIIEFVGGDNELTYCYLEGGSGVADGIELRPFTELDMWHNYLQNINDGIKDDGLAPLAFGSTFAENVDNVIRLHDPRHHVITETENSWTAGYDSIICETVTNLIVIGSDSYDAGIMIYLPHMKAGGYGSFTNDADFQNNTMDIERMYQITVGGDGVQYIKQAQLSASLTDGAPTDAEIDTATGTTPATVGAGWSVTILDSDGTGLLYRIESDGTNWLYQAMTTAL